MHHCSNARFACAVGGGDSKLAISFRSFLTSEGSDGSGRTNAAEAGLAWIMLLIRPLVMTFMLVCATGWMSCAPPALPALLHGWLVRGDGRGLCFLVG